VTGAGGANVWTHALIQQYLVGSNSPVKPLPAEASFNVAVRRCTRVGKNAGRLIEDLGVVPNQIHRPTKNDLLKGDVDLINLAAEILKPLPVRRVIANIQKKDGVTTAVVTTRNVDRLDLLLDSRPRGSLDVTDGTTRINLSEIAPNAAQLRLDGYHGGVLVASTRAQL
jgi:hypothetical protein